MITTLDFLYLVLAFCAIAGTVMFVLLASEWLRVGKDLRSIARDVEQISHLVERIAVVVFPGMERVARKAVAGVEGVEDKINSLFGTKLGRKK